MKFYFNSPVPSALKIDGRLMPPSIWDKPVDLEVKNCSFIEYCPVNTPHLLSYFLSEELIKNPPLSMEICDLQGGYDVSFIPPSEILPFKVITQKKTDACFTIFCQNGYNLSVESKSDFFSYNLPKASDYEIIPFYLDQVLLTAVIAYSDKRQILVFDTSGEKINLLLNQTVNTIDLQNGLAIKKTYFDIAKHTVEIFYGYKNGGLYVKNKNIKTHPSFDKFSLHDRLIPYAFMEEFLVGGDYGFYLSDEIKQNKSKLSSYFGDFLGVIPPPKFRQEKEVGLIKKRKKNLYFIDYYSFDISGGKIRNLFKN